MERFGHLLLRVWREACRHTEIGEAVSQSAPDLLGRFPIDQLLIRRFDLPRRLVETAAIGNCTTHATSSQPRTELEAVEFDRLLRWCERREVIRCGVEPNTNVPLGVVPLGLTGDVMAGPLVGEHGPIGVVLFVAQNPNTFQPRHERVLRLLLEPFSVWLENDRRLRELTSLREAAEADNRSLLARLGRYDISDSIVGAETGLRHVMERVEQVARTNVPVLILGETGSGKEVVARAIHQRSSRAAGPFLRVNCGAIAPELVDSELFGHERGSFTGATGQRKGWFERADGGTLFLDECGELTPAAQVRLLRILQDGTFERVGGEQQVKVDVRIIAATHRDLQSMMSSSRFREDLWYRLAVFPIRLPPLRDRVEDIPALAQHFAAKAAQRMGAPLLTPSQADIDLLVSYGWPGNIRELAAVIERAVILGDGRRLEVAKALGPMPARAAREPQEAVILEMPHPAQQLDRFSSLDEAMRGHIESALERTHGRIEGPFGAAKLLGINPHTLRGRMRSLGLDWRRFRIKERAEGTA
jgi:transcriptional regulator with GAF, ATPase, and Fis domain